MTRFVSTLVSVFASGPAVAAGSEPPFWSASLGVTDTRARIEHSGETGWAQGPSEGGYMIGGGLRFTEHLALDLGYLRTDGLEWNTRFSEPGPVSGGCDLLGLLLFGICWEQRASIRYENQVHVDASVVQASAVGIVSFGSIWEAYAKGGVANYRLSGHEDALAVQSGDRVVQEVERSDSGALLGLGIGADLTPSWHLRLEYQIFVIDDDLVRGDTQTATVETWSLTLDHRFSSRRSRRN